ncbi:tRNA synthetase class II [Exidia glandulosa HHB12029]|uniref:Alanine--tRNA ligase n=1 Tax=Exidia glandulosa HHB12029 TaxID=1314781 RepID=A0A165CSD1_EXIGL|nr:tRNA synthetase class II [Exidia glandulosa HHB12029]
MAHQTPYTGHWTAANVRKAYFDFFEQNGHTFVRSSSTIPYDDPTLLFANAGMNQYKPIFLGTVDPNSDLSKLKRAYNSQKCIRAGGKHNADLEDVGKDSYHHTFFEMLGNWSFGDYFKKEAITFSWKLLTEVYGLPKDRLYVTYFEGNPAAGLEPDHEARDIWLSLDGACFGDDGDSARSKRWPIGAARKALPGAVPDSQSFVAGSGGLHSVPEPIETAALAPALYTCAGARESKGARSAGYRDGRTSRHAIEIHSPLRDCVINMDMHACEKCEDEAVGGSGTVGSSGNDDGWAMETVGGMMIGEQTERIRTVHGGAIGMRLRDGLDGIRKELKRRRTHELDETFNVEIGSFFSTLAPTLIDQLGDVFPELTKKYDDIKEILDEEEESFARTLDRGEKLFEKYVAQAREAGKTELGGKDVWRLYDTFGFPVDLTRLMAEELGLGINEAEFEAAQAHSKEASKGAGKQGSKETVKLDVHDIAKLEADASVPKTNDSAKFRVGKAAELTATVKAIYYNKSLLQSSESIPEGESFGVILDKTNFYAESGGQEYDTGTIVIDGEAAFDVTNVQLYNGYVLHIGSLKEGTLKVGDAVLPTYDELRRWPLRNNHTATHILNYSLRETLGDHIDQKGSLVAPTKLRFDFSHKAQIPLPDLQKIEQGSRDWIKKNVKVFSKELDLKSGYKIPGLRAVFGEAYPDPVRVVTLEYDVEDIAKDLENPKWRNTSVEFCGGTHVAETGTIKDFIITEESGIAKGIRRIIAVTGHEAAEVTRVAAGIEQSLARVESLTGKEKDSALKALTVELNNADISVLRKAELKETLTKLRKAFDDDVKAREKAQTKTAVDAVTNHFKESPNSPAFVSVVEGGNAKLLQSVLNQGKALDKPVYVFTVDDTGEKVMHAAFVPQTQISTSFDARVWASSVTDILGGKAGGKADTAQGVGANVTRLDEAVAVARKRFA